jgi:hypothetical protein
MFESLGRRYFYLDGSETETTDDPRYQFQSLTVPVFEADFPFRILFMVLLETMVTIVDRDNDPFHAPKIRIACFDFVVVVDHTKINTLVSRGGHCRILEFVPIIHHTTSF